MDDLLDIDLAADTSKLDGAILRGETAIRDALGAPVAAFPWDKLSEALAAGIMREVVGKWLHWLVDGWCLAREIHKHAEPAKVHSGAVASVKLLRHPLSGKLPVDVNVTCAGIRAPPIRFELKLTADIHGATLWIRRGHIVAIEGGACDVSATLLFLGKALCDEVKLDSLKLPLKREFAEPGIRIPRLAVFDDRETEAATITATIPPAPAA